ncbi:transaldolase [Dehalogenimonas lykanthroporepellens BL-DC-9]|nr:transaldolase [Dehalogenimonas lykanthroporepellens BL-DC-9]
MRLFLDTAVIEEIRKAADMGVIHGVTTNPTLVARAGHKDYKALVQEIASILPEGSPISVESVAEDAKTMVADGKRFFGWAPDNAVIKLPTTADGLSATRELAKEGIQVNMTLCFSVNQALLAAHAGAAYISPFVGRLDDIGHDGMQLVRDIVNMLEEYSFDAWVISASIRHPLHCVESMKAGAQVATVPYKILEQMLRHPLTDKGIQAFMDDWKKSGATNA